jgi:hypothetical protein
MGASKSIFIREENLTDEMVAEAIKIIFDS